MYLCKICFEFGKFVSTNTLRSTVSKSIPIVLWRCIFYGVVYTICPPPQRQKLYKPIYAHICVYSRFVEEFESDGERVQNAFDANSLEHFTVYKYVKHVKVFCMQNQQMAIILGHYLHTIIYPTFLFFPDYADIILSPTERSRTTKINFHLA